jgi:hypothetical protein
MKIPHVRITKVDHKIMILAWYKLSSPYACAQNDSVETRAQLQTSKTMEA